MHIFQIPDFDTKRNFEYNYIIHIRNNFIFLTWLYNLLKISLFFQIILILIVTPSCYDLKLLDYNFLRSLAPSVCTTWDSPFPSTDHSHWGHKVVMLYCPTQVDKGVEIVYQLPECNATCKYIISIIFCFRIYHICNYEYYLYMYWHMQLGIISISYCNIFSHRVFVLLFLFWGREGGAVNKCQDHFLFYTGLDTLERKNAHLHNFRENKNPNSMEILRSCRVKKKKVQRCCKYFVCLLFLHSREIGDGVTSRNNTQIKLIVFSIKQPACFGAGFVIFSGISINFFLTLCSVISTASIRKS